jgi:LysM repeat protein
MTNIAKRYNISVARLKELNNMADGNIKIGQVLKVK